MPARDNPFSKINTSYLFNNASSDKLDSDELSDRGYIVAPISNIPRKKRETRRIYSAAKKVRIIFYILSI